MRQHLTDSSLRKWIAAIALLASFSSAARAEDFTLFESKIRPLLADKCYQCHSPQAKKLKGGLLLDTKQGVLKGGENGPAIVPGDPDHSRLIEAVRWGNKDLQMPPKERLTPEQVADLETWIKSGAPDPRTGPSQPVAGAAIDYAAARKQWAFHAPEEHPIPSVQQKEWCRSAIDQFILAKLEEKGLKPAPQAQKRVLIRRAYFDLVGLPPSVDDVEAFVKDESPEAFAKVVDKLLASPHYGERWGRHWLDVVRYTDSFDARGIGSDGDCTEAFRYRDWVVKAFNTDLPYDQFVMNQVAGDLLPAKNPDEFNADGLIATGMYAIGNWPGGDADRKKMLTDIVDDQVDVTGRAFLGLTLACARCHDHKFDPIASTDYYGLAGIFFSSHFLPNEGNSTAGGPMGRFPLASPSQVEKRKKQVEAVAQMQKSIEQARDEQYLAAGRAIIAQADQYLAAVWEYRQPGNAVPAIDSFAAAHHLDAATLGRWLDYAGPMLKSGAQRTLLATPRHNINGIAGLDGWTGPVDQPPGMMANTTDHVVTFSTITLPPKCVSVHPGQKSGVAVGWRSPISGTVSVRGRVIDADSVCGNGIDWAIDTMSEKSSRRLASGTFPNGGRQEFSAGDDAKALEAIEVKAGDFVQVAVYPKGDYSCDTTVVELDITEVDGAKRAWNLAKDVLPDVLVGGAGNPHADSLGNAGVWQFYEIPDEAPGGVAAGESDLTKWARAASLAHSAEDAATAARPLRDALAALDTRAEELRKSGKKASDLTGPDAKLYDDLTSPGGPFWKPLRATEGGLPPESRQQLAKMQEQLAALQKEVMPAIPVCHALAEGGVPGSMYDGIRDTRIHIRGRYDRMGDPAPRQFPRLLAGDEQKPITSGSGRMELARWLASPQNPQTARVMVNRLWQHHFGEGIVRTPNNYGKLGQPPTHPELLDWLAREFVAKGWSIKSMHREMMLSAAYQQSSVPDSATLKADPEDLLLGWMKRRRLEAEAIRDSLLVQAGTLDETIGGPSVRDLNTPRRTLYITTIRSNRNDYRTLFDAADPTAIVDQRNDSTVAPQALFLMNDPFALAQTKALSERVIKQGTPDDAGRIDWLYRRLYSRAPSDKEIEIGLTMLKEAQQPEGGKPPLAKDAAWEAYCQVLVCANEFVYVE
jgi:hypothetical protein